MNSLELENKKQDIVVGRWSGYHSYLSAEHLSLRACCIQIIILVAHRVCAVIKIQIDTGYLRACALRLHLCRVHKYRCAQNTQRKAADRFAPMSQHPQVFGTDYMYNEDFHKEKEFYAIDATSSLLLTAKVYLTIFLLTFL